MTRPIQRAGHIGDADNRFCGAPVFAELAPRGADAIDLIARAAGLPPLSRVDRDALRLVTLCVTSPDARVWPLKVARTLASYGSAAAGLYGAQLGNGGTIMGPGTAANGARSLAWLRARIGDDPTDDAIAEAIAAHTATRGRLAGFGVPLREQDERVLGLRRLAAAHPMAARPHYRLVERVIDVMRAREGVEPNIVAYAVAIFLDLGLAPHRAGILLSLLMTQNFAAHAIEAADTDGDALRELPAAALEDRTAPARRTPAALAEAAAGSASSPRALGAAGFGPRRSLAW